MLILNLILVIAALVLFLLAAWGRVATSVNLGWLGLACLTFSILISGVAWPIHG